MFWSGMNTSVGRTSFYTWYQITIFSAYRERFYYSATIADESAVSTGANTTEMVNIPWFTGNVSNGNQGYTYLP
jgi:hypothetical protein